MSGIGEGYEMWGEIYVLPALKIEKNFNRV
jgi:hypothetical protein